MQTPSNPYPDDEVRYLHVSGHDHEGFVVWIYWVRTQDGRAVPARMVIEAQGLVGTEIGDPIPTPTTNTIRGLSSAIVRSLPVGTFIAQGRAAGVGGVDDADRQALTAPPVTSYDDKRRLAAQVVHDIVLGGNRRNPYAEALPVLDRMQIRGRGDTALTARRLAKWIKDAKGRGEYPPPDARRESK